MNLVESGRDFQRHVAGALKNPAIFLTDQNTGKEYSVIRANAPDDTFKSVVIDKADFDAHASSIYVQLNGYPYFRCVSDGACVTHHSFIMDKMNNSHIPKGHSIDHINWQKTDNRRENLRMASQAVQNSNRTQRTDKHPPPPELLALGIMNLPRLVRWDVGEKKFVIDVQNKVSGSKSNQVTTINKFRGILNKLIAYYRIAGIADTVDYSHRIKLADEYNQIVRAAHLSSPDVFPDGPYANLSDMWSPVEYADLCLSKLPPLAPGELMHGPLNVEQRFVDLPDFNAVAIVKKEFVVLFDRQYTEIVRNLPSLEIDNKKVCRFAKSPLLSRAFPGFDLNTISDSEDKNKIVAKELVWGAFFRRPIPNGFCITPKNYQQYDLREANLQLLPGKGSNFQAPGTFKVSSEYDIGMRFWPKGVTLINTEKTKEFSVKFEGQKTKPTWEKRGAINVFKSSVIPWLKEKDPLWDANNDEYQLLIGQYMDIVEMLINQD